MRTLLVFFLLAPAVASATPYKVEITLADRMVTWSVKKNGQTQKYQRTLAEYKRPQSAKPGIDGGVNIYYQTSNVLRGSLIKQPGLKGTPFARLPQADGSWQDVELGQYNADFKDSDYTLAVALEGKYQQADAHALLKHGAALGLKRPNGKILWFQKPGDNFMPQLVGFPNVPSQGNLKFF